IARTASSLDAPNFIEYRRLHVLACITAQPGQPVINLVFKSKDEVRSSPVEDLALLRSSPGEWVCALNPHRNRVLTGKRERVMAWNEHVVAFSTEHGNGTWAIHGSRHTAILAVIPIGTTVLCEGLPRGVIEGQKKNLAVACEKRIF